ncbi:hypothetical protein OG401_01085 [Kitasatospora purpeofusca]|uniref:hypothetical protein n=1 Tax=Kitasatospora purpeofusca TaxID=67352 RepID=UPI00225438FC|nr:hypothetical protein [Kitasatospora purpeofusca]MCX4682915.1 hypothetical protein [Kitasatospora purpeofusca]
MPAPVAPLTDSELCGLLVAPPVRRAAAEELMRRHGEAVLACAGVLCGDRQSAETLTVEAFNRALDVFDHGPVQDLTWLSCLVGEARRLAARWADDGRPDRLSPAFAGWLRHRQQESARAGFVAALRTAESGCPLLRALHRLPEPAATEVWHSLLQAPGAGAPAGPVRQELAMAYLRERNSLVAERLCRHLAVRLADAASDGRAADPEVTGHLDGCEPCARALADLRAVHHWDLARLRTRALLDHWEPGPQAPSTAGAEHTVSRPGPGPGPAPGPAGAGPRPPGHRRRPRSARHARKPRTAAVWAAGLGTLTLACALTPVLAAPDRERTAPSVPTRPEGPGTEPAPTPRTATPTSSTPASSAPTPAAGRPAVRSPGPPASP